jgi:hypothetical protein
MVSTREHDPYREAMFHSIVSSGIVQADRVPPQLLTSNLIEFDVLTTSIQCAFLKICNSTFGASHMMFRSNPLERRSALSKMPAGIRASPLEN